MKHRRLLMILMTICLCVGLFTVSASAASGSCGDVNWRVSGNTLTISGNGDMDDYDYLNTVAPWHNYYESITQIVIKNGVEEIGDYAFADMIYATSVTIPSSVITIDDYAFECCYSLKEMEISKNVTSLGDGVVYNKAKTKLLCVPGTFEGKFTVPNTVTAIKESMA